MLKSNLVMQAIFIALGFAAVLFSSCESDDVISGTSYSGPAAVFHSETRYLDTDSSSCLKAPLPWDTQRQRPDCQLEVKYYREKTGTNTVPFPCPALKSGTWSGSWQSSVTSIIGAERTQYDVAHCLMSPTASPLECGDTGDAQSTDTDSPGDDTEEIGNEWYYCENDADSEAASNTCLYNVGVSPSLIAEVTEHPKQKGGLELSCSQTGSSPTPNGVTGLAIGDACATQKYISEAGSLLSPSVNADNILFWLEAQAPQCSQGLCLSSVRRTPGKEPFNIIEECIGDDSTVASCAAASYIYETSECTCRCADADGNRAEEDDSLCTCPDNMFCQNVAEMYSSYPTELLGGYCMAL